MDEDVINKISNLNIELGENEYNLSESDGAKISSMRKFVEGTPAVFQCDKNSFLIANRLVGNLSHFGDDPLDNYPLFSTFYSSPAMLMSAKESMVRFAVAGYDYEIYMDQTTSDFMSGFPYEPEIIKNIDTDTKRVELLFGLKIYKSDEIEG